MSQYSTSSIYAIGDAVHGPMLAHKAEDEGTNIKFLFPKITWILMLSINCTSKNFKNGHFGDVSQKTMFLKGFYQCILSKRESYFS